MNKVIAILTLLAISTSVQADESRWLTNYAVAMNQSRATERPLLLIISRDELFPVSFTRSNPSQRKQALRDLLDGYVLCRIDANSGYGKRVAESFRVEQFPHSVIIDKTTKQVLYRQNGRATDAAWEATLARYKDVAPVQPVFVTQPQTPVRSPSRPVFERPVFERSNFFRIPAFCNT